AYDIAASAASYVQQRAKNLLTLAAKSQQSEIEDFNGRKDSPEQEEEDTSRDYKSEVAAYMAASTVTSVVAAGERERQEAATNLQSLHSSPCEWFVCDDFSNYTRCFVIQGSDSLSSWQANLFFEPTKFEVRTKNNSLLLKWISLHSLCCKKI
ncbi:alpha/beta-hydrolases superfamily protein, partial [Trifolium medium]|nr:alpha/beta-hydrolases superfamily protein [Trifolium medium]